MITLSTVRLAYTAKCLEIKRLRLIISNYKNALIGRDLVIEKLMREVTQLEKQLKEKLGEQK